MSSSARLVYSCVFVGRGGGGGEVSKVAKKRSAGSKHRERIIKGVCSKMINHSQTFLYTLLTVIIILPICSKRDHRPNDQSKEHVGGGS